MALSEGLDARKLLRFGGMAGDEFPLKYKQKKKYKHAEGRENRKVRYSAIQHINLFLTWSEALAKQRRKTTQVLEVQNLGMDFY